MEENKPVEVSFNLGCLEENAGYQKIERERIKGLCHFRILPPYGTEHKGSLFHYYAVHWGFTGRNGKARPIACSYPTEKKCPVCEQVFDAKNALDDIKKSGDRPENKAKKEELLNYIKMFGVRRSYSYNVATLDGRVVVLDVPVSLQDKLRELIVEAVYKRGFDPTNLKTGCWFTFDRKGTGFDTEYSVKFKKNIVMVDGEELEKTDKTPLPDDLVEKITAQLSGKTNSGPLYDIHVLYKPTTYKEISEIMNGSLVEDAEEANPVSEDMPPIENNPINETFKSAGPGPAIDIPAEMDRLRKLGV